MFVIIVRQDAYKKTYLSGIDTQGYWITSENARDAMNFSDFTVARDFAYKNKIWSARVE